MKKLSVIIPVYNEEDSLEAMYQEVAKIDLGDHGYTKEIIFVNDGSRDNSKDIIHKLIEKYDTHDIKYIENPKNSGKGYSMKNWIKNATGDVLLIQDADLEYSPSDYHTLLKTMHKHDADIVYGSRTLGKKKFNNNYSTKTFLYGGLVVSLLTSLLSFTKVTDEPTCYKMFKSHLKPYLLHPQENRFEREPAVTMLLLRKGFSYKETPIHYQARGFDEGKKINRKDGVQALTTLIKRRFKKIPNLQNDT